MKDMNDDRTVNVKALIDDLVGELLDLATKQGIEVPDRDLVERAIGRDTDK